MMTQNGTVDNNTFHSLEYLHKRTLKHLRVGREQLAGGKISLGLITLYDALITAMSWFMAIPENRKRIIIRKGDDLNKDKVIFNILARCGIIGRGLNYDAFNGIVEEALKKDMSEFDFELTIKEIENVMGDLGILSYEENGLPETPQSTRLDFP
jgi:hypothetical protein